MAFVHDIEADRIDDFNVFSAFVRVPLLILGGVLGGGKSESNRSSSSKENGMSDEDLDGSTSTLATHPMKEDGHCEDDDAMDCSSSSSTTRLDNEDCHVSPQHHPNCRIVSNTDIDETDTADAEGLKRSKKMSWSDSQGLSLVEYNDESLPHEPQHSTQKPKSVMKKCNAERDPAATKPSAANDPKRYIPKMGGASTINMPSFSHSGGGSPGYVSPEWGWYINTTPPTPEMYHSQSSFGPSSKLTRTDASGAPTFPFASHQHTSAKTSQCQATSQPSLSELAEQHESKYGLDQRSHLNEEKPYLWHSLSLSHTHPTLPWKQQPCFLYSFHLRHLTLLYASYHDPPPRHGHSQHCSRSADDPLHMKLYSCKLVLL